jgi:hypothetical protein
MYQQRLRRNLKPVITDHGVTLTAQDSTLESISARHIFNVVNGHATVTVATLEALADEIGADFLEFFRE